MPNIHGHLEFYAFPDYKLPVEEIYLKCGNPPWVIDRTWGLYEMLELNLWWKFLSYKAKAENFEVIYDLFKSTVHAGWLWILVYSLSFEDFV